MTLNATLNGVVSMEKTTFTLFFNASLKPISPEKIPFIIFQASINGDAKVETIIFPKFITPPITHCIAPKIKENTFFTSDQIPYKADLTIVNAPTNTILKRFITTPSTPFITSPKPLKMEIIPSNTPLTIVFTAVNAPLKSPFKMLPMIRKIPENTERKILSTPLMILNAPVKPIVKNENNGSK